LFNSPVTLGRGGTPPESDEPLIKRIKRIGFGFRNFENHRIRALLYAGKPNWRVLGSIVVR
jgi:transposase